MGDISMGNRGEPCKLILRDRENSDKTNVAREIFDGFPTALIQ
jgi:hypothetical protein